MPPPLDSLPPFPGFRDDALQFLRDLRENNERDWFLPRKTVYEDEILWPARCLVAQLSADGARAGVPLSGKPGKSVFRIYRDVRFSKNKDPYKTHLGFALTRSGHKDDPGGIYVHIEPGGCFVAAGFWLPDPKTLLPRWRDRLASSPEAWLGVVEALTDEGFTLDPGPSGSLKRMPRGFESFADEAIAPYLKWKGSVATQQIPDALVQTPDFADTVLDISRAARPLLDWGWALDG